MVNPDNITFPITGEQLANLQRAEVGRELTSAELELFAEIADMANETYEAAAKGDVDTVQDILNAVNAVPAPDSYTRHLTALCRGWVLLACQRGAQQLKAIIDGLS